MIKSFRLFGSSINERYLKRCIFWRRHAKVRTPLFVPNSLQPLEPRMLFAADPVFLVNVGGPSVVSVGGQVWEEDSNANPSPLLQSNLTTTTSTASSIDVTDLSIPGDTPTSIFQTQRQGVPNPTGALSWDFALDPGDYNVSLYFAEIETPTPMTGDRRFTIVAEGQLQEINYDIVSEAGAGFKGVVETFEVSVNDGILDLGFSVVSDEAALNGIMISEAVDPGDNVAPTVSAGPDGGALIGADFVLDGTVTDDGLPAATVATMWTVLTGPASSNVAFGDAAAIDTTANFDTAGSYTLRLTADDGELFAFDDIQVVVTDPAVNTPPSVSAGVDDEVVVGGSLTLDGTVADDGLPGTGISTMWTVLTSPASSVVTFGDDTAIDTAATFDTAGIYTLRLTASDGELTTFSDVEITVSEPTGNLATLSAAPADAGETQAGDLNKTTVTVTHTGNSGDNDITISNASITGPDADHFGVIFDTSNGVTLTPGESVELTVFFTPDAADGVNTATLNLINDGSDPSVAVALTADAVDPVNIDFGKSQVQGLAPGLLPTTIQFGPDGRLYAGHLDGTIIAYTVERNGANDYAVTDTEVIELVKDIPNHDDNGTPQPGVQDRLVTGLYVTGTPANPEIYVGSSDPRLTGGGQDGGDTGLDTNSGVISKLTFNGTNWEKIDLVRGLPRSEADHALNGIQITDDNILLVSIGGNTNMGAPSNNFAFLAEYALDTAIIGIDLDAVEALPTQLDPVSGEAFKYNLPTLDDEDRDFDGSGGDEDLSQGIQDVFGGNDGKNQARLVTGGPVFVYASGFRNPYDLVITEEGLLYAIDNGPNAGWGGSPIFDAGEVTNQVSEPGISLPDNLHIVEQGGYYGHPNPTRADRDNTFNPTNPQSPIDPGLENPDEAFYLAPKGSNQNTYPEDDALATFDNSTNGLTEYTASNFGGALQGDLLLTSLSNTLERVKLDASSASVFVQDTLVNNVGQYILDVTAVGDDGVFPGTVWVTDLFGATIYVFEPADFDGETGGGVVNPNDLDDDGYTNQDEIDNGTNPNSGADTPNDADQDFVSNLNDPDDDNDSPDQITLIDSNDPFANDPQNGLDNVGGYSLSFDTEDPNRGGILGLGFTGLMTNNSSDYESLFDPDNFTAGGAAGVLTIDVVSSGSARGVINDQENAFQFGVNLNGSSEPVTAHTRINTPWSGLNPAAGQQIGFYVGTGDQSNYLELYLDGDGSVNLLKEVDDSPVVVASVPITLAGAGAIDLFLDLDPTTGQLVARYSMDGNSAVTVGSTTIPAAWYNGGDAMAVGVISTDQSVGGDPFFATYDLLSIAPTDVVVTAGPDQTVEVDDQITLDGNAADDGLPQPLSVQWTQISGPVDVTIGDATSSVATVTLPEFGVYVFEITATDGLNIKTDQVVITAEDAGTSQDVELIVEPGAGGDGDSEVLGSWAWSQFDPGFFGDNYRHDRNNGKGSKSIIVTPDIPVGGDYEVFAWWPSTNARATNVPYTINHAGGADEVQQNQRQDGSQWNSLGTYRFDANAGHNVVVSNEGTNGTVVADAFRFVLINADQPPARPGNVVATTTGDTTVNLAWSDTATDETGFRVERRVIGSAFAEVATVAAGVTSFDDTGLAEGLIYEYRVFAFNAVGDSQASAAAVVQTTGGTNEGPFNGLPVVVPGLIQAEEFDLGEAGVAYNDTTAGNTGGEFRTDVDVDIEATTDTGGGFNLSFLAPSEFVNYTIDVAEAGFYDIDVRVANGGSGGQFSLFFDGVKKTPSVNMPNTGGFQTWQTISINGVFLDAGQQVMGLVIENTPFGGDLGNINWFQFNLTDAQPVVDAGADQQLAEPGVVNLVGAVTDDGSPTLQWSVVEGPAAVTFGDDTAASTAATFVTPGLYTLRLTADDGTFLVSDDIVIDVAATQNPFGGIVRDVTSRIELEDYDLGGAGVAFNDTTPTNLGNADPRGDAVDLETTADVEGNLNVGFVEAGEWLEYTVSVPVTGDYSAEIRVAALGTGGVFHLELDGVDVSGPIAVPDTGDFQTWQTVLVPNLSLTTGTQVLRIAFDANGSSGFVGNFNWLTFTELASSNIAPIVEAGENAAVFAGNTLNLAGVVTDDGLPANTVTSAWTIESAPAAAVATFGNAASPTTTVSFDTVGTYVLRLTASDGALTSFDELTVTVGEAQVVDIILEAGLSDDVTVNGNWAWSKFDPNFFGDNYRHDRNNGKGSKSVDFMPTIPVEGDYEVFVWYNSTAGRATNVPYTVTHANGSELITINQRQNGGQWVSLGVYNLLADSGHGLTVSNTGTNGTVIADAARFELVAPNASLNTPPAVNAGADATAFINTDFDLTGLVTDDGKPGVGVTTQWTVIAGPASSVVAFGDDTAASTSVSFDTVGTYTLRITADDSELTGFDDIVLTVTDPSVNNAPVVTAAADGTVNTGTSFTLDATVTDDGLPSATLTTLWTVVSGPVDGVATFVDSAAVDTTVSFDTPGTYVLRLTANDGEFTVADDLAVVVSDPVQSVEIILESGLNDGATVTGDWAWSKFDPGFFGDNYRHDRNNGKGNKSAAYVPTLPVAGEYELFVQYPATNARATNVPYTITHDGGTTVVTLNQRLNGGQWVSLGTFDLTPGQGHGIVINTGGTNGTVIADAARFLLEGNTGPVNSAPTVDAGSDAANLLNSPLTLSGTVDDDGLPGTGLVSTWSVTSAPVDAVVTFADASSPSTTAALDTAGEYVLRLTVTDGELTSFDELIVTVFDPSPNQAPTVDAGINDAAIIGVTYALDATVTDDGQPTGSVTTLWTVVASPASSVVTFGDETAVDTIATFDTAGVYTLRLTADDGEFTPFDEVMITVNEPGSNQPPTVEAGDDQTVLLGATPTLTGSASDDGQPAGTLTAAWTVVSSPTGSTVEFIDANQANTAVELSDPGTYVLRLTADDGEQTGFDNVTITVENVIDATVLTNHRINLDDTADLNARVAGPGTVTAAWTKLSGPGNVVFGDASAADTTATFDAVGTYVLQLTADNGSATDTALLTVTVDPAQDLGVILDSDGSDPNVVTVGSWNFTTNDPGFFGNNYRTDQNSGKGSKTMTYSPQLAESAVYEVLVRYTSTTGRATNVPYTINHAGGSDTVTINQRFFGGEWVSLGFYPFLNDGSGSVVISNAGTNGTVVADAVRFDQPSTVPTQNFPTSWTVDPSIESPIQSYERQTAFVNGKVYAFGGFVPGFGVTKRLDIFDPVTNTWTTGSPLPDGLTESHAGVTHDGKTVYLVGGFEGDFDANNDPPQPVNNRVWAYDTTTDTYTELARLPDLRGNMTAAVVGRELHAFGGNTEDRNTNSVDHWVLQLGATDSTTDDGAVWERRSDVPDARDHASHVVLDGKIYYIAGEFGHDLIHIQTPLLHVYDPVTDAWTRLADAPTAKSHGEGMTFHFVQDGRIYFVGGQSGSGDDFVGTREISSYDPVENVWTVNVPLPIEIQGGIVFPTDDGRVIATLGGIFPTNPQSTTRVGFFTPVASLPDPGGNIAPTVDAGPDDAVQTNTVLSLDGTVTDDGLPSPGSVTAAWTLENGPVGGVAAFGDDTAINTTVSFDLAGTYVLRLTADDGDLTAFDELTVTVTDPVSNTPPAVDAGDNTDALVGAALTLEAIVTDDGLPTPTGITTLWTVESAPSGAQVSFGDPAVANTNATFDTAGNYTLRLTVDDGELTAFDELTVSVSDAQAVDIILEAGLSDDVTVIGDWAWSQFDPGFFGDNYRHDRNNGKGSKTVEFTPTLPGAGTFEVSVWYSATNSRAINVPYTITHDGGTTQLTINQRINGGQWVSLGTFDMTPGQGHGVLLSNAGTNGTVVADAIRFEGIADGDDQNPDTEVPQTDLFNWVQQNDIPKARYEGMSLTLGNEMYLFGGYGDTLSDKTVRVDRYNPLTDTWTQLGDMPAVVNHQTAAYDPQTGTVWFVAGFLGAFPGSSTDQVWTYDVATDTWGTGPSLPAPRSAGVTGIVGRGLHFAGGFDTDRDTTHNDHWVLDLDNVAAGWAVAPDMPGERGHISTAVIGDRLYAIGGQIGHDDGPEDQADVWAFDVSENQWVTLASLPRGISHTEPSTFVWNDRIFVGGGRANQSGDVVLDRDELLMYDPGSDTWTQVATLPEGPLRGPTMQVVNDQIVLASGLIPPSGPFVPTDSVHVADLDENWLRGPDLPVDLGEVAAGVIDGTLLVIGDGDNATLAYDLATATWSDTGDDRPVPAKDQLAEVVDDQLYVFGGITYAGGQTIYNNTQIYDPAAGTWTAGADTPWPVFAGQTAVINGLIYLNGGVTTGGVTTNQTAVYDPATNMWSTLADSPLARNSAAVGTDGSKMYIFGGRDGGDTPGNGFDSVMIYDPVTNTWISSKDTTGLGANLTPLPQARGGIVNAPFIDGEFYVIGGETVNGDGATDDNVYFRVDIYNPTTNAWRRGVDMPTARHGIYPVGFAGTILVAGGGVVSGGSESPVFEIYYAGLAPAST
ncbi:MAG: kelch repeat-containing protein [Planctomycetota bacterium]